MITLDFFKIDFNIILVYTPNLPNRLLLSGIQTKFVYALAIVTVCATYIAHLTDLDFIFLAKFAEQYKL
jgi:hypothetical protein